MTGISKWLLLVFTLLLSPVFGREAHAQTVNAASCSSNDVQSAFNSVTSSTTIVNIPTCSGGVMWSSQVNLSIPPGNTNLTIQGQTTVAGTCGPGGSCTATDGTVILDNIANGSQPLVITTGAASTYFRITGITFLELSTATTKYNGLLSIGGSSQNVRIDHNHFNTSAGSGTLGVFISGWQYGVADHNVFDSGTSGSPGVNNGIHINMDSYANKASGHGSWASNTNFGSSSYFFVENNAFNYGFVNDCQAGGRQVIRYNLITEATAQTHPTTGGTTSRGCRASEVYENSFIGSNNFAGAPGELFYISSGTLLIWGNSAPTGYQNLVALRSLRRNNENHAQTATPAGWGYCGTSFNGTGSPWDQNSNVSTGYPCLDQPGRGVGQLLTGLFPGDGGSGVTNTATGTISWPNEALEPIYEWLDSWTAVPGYTGAIFSPDATNSFFVNSDYYGSSNPGSGSNCSGFTGASGVGCGLLSARPSTCTVQVGYWATDKNTLYTCNSPNTWTAYYTPFTYPHPLILSSGTSQVPAPPSNVQATVQ